MSISTTTEQSDTLQRLVSILAKAVLGIGAVLFVSYWLYLLFPALFSPDGAAGKYFGLIFYALATAGAAFVAWGLILWRLSNGEVTKKHILRATAVGVLLLGVMRIGTALFAHYPFDAMLFVPIGEATFFIGVSVLIYFQSR